MLKKTLAGLGLGLFSLMTVVPLTAQEVATLALRNGERPSGELIDLNASGYTLRIGGQERQFSANDVAAVEFVVGPLPADAQAKVNAGQSVVLLRSGQVIDGRLSDIGGTRPLRLTIDTPSGPREFSSNDIAQAHLFPLNRPAAVGTSGTQAAVASAPPAGTFTVPANQAWTDTGFVVRRGMRLAFTVNGDINLSAAASSNAAGSPAATVAGARYPVQGSPAGALVARIGNNRPFFIGTNSAPITMPDNGVLMLGINDDVLNDNSGNYTVGIAVSR